MNEERIRYLIDRYCQRLLSPEEADELYALTDTEVGSVLAILTQLSEQEAETSRFSVTRAAIQRNIDEVIAIDRTYTPAFPVHRVHFLKTAWLRYAAAVLIICTLAITYLWNTQKEEKHPVVTTNPVPVQNDVLPGGNKAMLTLSDGSTIVLDSTANGEIARQQSVIVTKRNDGQIVYQKNNDAAPTTVAYNTLGTPRGGQYQLVLPDGSRVWLNAESSIRYPVAFTGHERNVSITGEAYFEVAKDKTKPFRVKAGNETIEVLGTHFNVNAYADEAGIKTSLLEGSVRVSGKMLRPGQAHANGKAYATDVHQDVAWKDGVFNFQDVKIPEAMRQLARWYDVAVDYKADMNNVELGGEIGRSLTLQQVLRGLEGMDVYFKLEGKTLFVSNQKIH